MKENRKTKYTEEIIKKTYISLLLANPDHRVTIKELCEQADINRGTFYLHYQDIFALQRELEEEAVKQLLLLRPDNVILDDPQGLYIINFVENVLCTVHSRPELTCILHNKNASPNAFAEVLMQSHQKAAKRWMELGLDAEQTYWIFLLMIGALSELQKECSRSDFTGDIKYMAETIGQMLSHGLMSFFDASFAANHDES